MDIIQKMPELKAVLGHTGKEQEFRAIVKNMKSEDLALLNHYLSHKVSVADEDIWTKQRDVRKVEAQIKILQMDYHRLRSNMQKVQTTLRKSFGAIYRHPDKAEVKCLKTEKQKGLVKTGWVLRARPNSFGSLRGLSFFGINSAGRLKAKETASELDYENMRKDFDMDKKIASWIGFILKGVAHE